MNQNKLFRLWLCGFLILLSALTGCSTTTNNNTYYGGQTVVYQEPDPYPSPDAILERYFTPELISEMESDAGPIIRQYGVNVFSTSMYGRACISGSVNLKDVFDARIAANYETFLKYAWEEFGLKRGDRAAFYERFAEAANQFFLDFGYDAVLFRPDELNPVFTDPVNDTWLFVRDYPSNTYDIYYSSRVQNRRMAIEGGLKMRAMTATDELYYSNWAYYIPQEGAEYTPFVAPKSETPATYPAQDPYELYGTRSIGPSNYVPQDATPEQLALREEWGIVPTALQNRVVAVCGWKNETYAPDMVTNGFSFLNRPLSSTWGGWGLYLLPLDAAFWEDPNQ